MRIRILLAKPFWFIHDSSDWFNRVGCYIAYGKNWRKVGWQNYEA
jgi:hypothetical protein